MKIKVTGRTVHVQSTRFTARFDGAVLTSFADRRSGTEFVRKDGPSFPMELVYANNENLAADKHQQVAVQSVSDVAARIVLTGNDSERELFIYLDPATGDLCLRPNGQSARRGVLSVRWSLAFAADVRLVLPIVNGIRVETSQEFPRPGRFPWPSQWNAQMAVAEKGRASMMVHCQDTACKFKALNLRRDDGLATLGFESEQLGPVWDNRAAGGIEWRLNTYAGDWKAAAGRFRNWLRAAYPLKALRAARPAWVDEIDFAVCWSSANLELLPALAKLHKPGRTLIHLSNWRTSAYDVDYPDYLASKEGLAFMKQANAMGFRVMPHFNFFACFNKHPFYHRVRDWQIRNVMKNEPEGWYWPPDTHDYTRMAYIHPGLSLWRRQLMDNILGACRNVSAPAAFLDQTLCTWNTDNGLVENRTTVEGMLALHEELNAACPDLVLAGEGLNEISFQRQAFAQAHIFDGWQNLAQRHVDTTHPLGAFLWEGQTRFVGYYHLKPECTDSWHGQMDFGIDVYRRMGAIPTIVPPNDPAHLSIRHPLVKRLMDLVKK